MKLFQWRLVLFGLFCLLTSLLTDAKQRFSMWTEDQDMTGRNSKELEASDIGLSKGLASLRACVGTGGRDDSCEKHEAEIPLDTLILNISAEVPWINDKVDPYRGDSTIVLILRYWGQEDAELEEPEVIFRETKTLGNDVGTYTLTVSTPGEFLDSGKFELLGFMNYDVSHPVRKLFSLKQS